MRCCRRRSGAATGRRQSRQQRSGPTPPMPSALAQAALEGYLAGKVHVLASDPKDRLGRLLWRGLGGRFPGVQLLRRNLPQSEILPATASSDQQTKRRKTH